MRRIILFLAICMAVVGLLASSSSPAGAWSERYVNRSCGTNFIQSWVSGTTSYRGQTNRVSGSCNSTLYVYIRNASGNLQGGPGTTSSASVTMPYSSPSGAIGGNHKGCPSCGYSQT